MTDAPFRLVAEDAHVLAVEKPPGMVTHPVYRHPDGTLTDAVNAWAQERGMAKPWLLHRLDRDTSGVVLFAKTETALTLMAKQFARHTVEKRYLATVWSADLPDEGRFDAPLARDPADRRRVIVSSEGQTALTRFAIVERGEGWALVECRPQTGRTHQIRAHLAHAGHPIIGDPVYANNVAPFPGVDRLMLHAAAIALLVPGATQPVRRSYLAPPPNDFLAALDALRHPEHFRLATGER